MKNDTCSLCKKDYSYKNTIHYCPHCGYNVGEYIEIPNIMILFSRIFHFITIIGIIILFPCFFVYLILHLLNLSTNFDEFHMYLFILFLLFIFSKFLKYYTFKLSKKNIKK